jgi:uncharacterized protein YdcH (DUF465 family)
MLEKDIRLLNKVIRKGENGEVSYSDSELHYMKKKRRRLQEWKRSAQISQNNGFGQYVNEQNDDD